MTFSLRSILAVYNASLLSWSIDKIQIERSMNICLIGSIEYAYLATRYDSLAHKK